MNSHIYGILLYCNGAENFLLPSDVLTTVMFALGRASLPDVAADSTQAKAASCPGPDFLSLSLPASYPYHTSPGHRLSAASSTGIDPAEKEARKHRWTNRAKQREGFQGGGDTSQSSAGWDGNPPRSQTSRSQSPRIGVQISTAERRSVTRLERPTNHSTGRRSVTRLERPTNHRSGGGANRGWRGRPITAPGGRASRGWRGRPITAAEAGQAGGGVAPGSALSPVPPRWPVPGWRPGCPSGGPEPQIPAL
ncbi:hypothetical protein LEMLEM_LOCUS12958 [Lemmus lemmus]